MFGGRGILSCLFQERSLEQLVDRSDKVQFALDRMVARLERTNINVHLKKISGGRTGKIYQVELTSPMGNRLQLELQAFDLTDQNSNSFMLRVCREEDPEQLQTDRIWTSRWSYDSIDAKVKKAAQHCVDVMSRLDFLMLQRQMYQSKHELGVSPKPAQ